MGDIIEFSKRKRGHKKTDEKRVLSKKHRKKTSIAVKMIGLTLFYVFIMCQGIISMGTLHAAALIIFVSFWASMFALSAHHIITSHYQITSLSKKHT